MQFMQTLSPKKWLAGKRWNLNPKLKDLQLSSPTDGFEFKEKLAALNTALLEKHPRMPSLLREIHQALKKQPENVTLFTEEDMATIFKALETHTNTFLVDSITATAKKSSATKALKQRINLGTL